MDIFIHDTYIIIHPLGLALLVGAILGSVSLAIILVWVFSSRRRQS